MRAVLYVMEQNKRWEGRYSIDWDVDFLFWYSPLFRRRVQKDWRQTLMSGCGRIVRLKQAVPLGLAASACDWINKSNQQHSNDPRDMLVKAVRMAAIKAGEPDAVAGDNEVEAVVCENDTRADRSQSEDVSEQMASYVSPGGKLDAAKLVSQAEEVMKRMHGLSLLYSEALVALDAVDAELRAALQFAYVLGGVRLVAAVAPDTARISWHRHWRHNAKVSLRCRRCGSGEEYLRRTACAACGRQRCAYCEACLTMGRSRECGLLVMGRPVTQSTLFNHARPDITAQVRSVECWGLSPAQQDAAGAALAYLRRTIGSGSIAVPTAAEQRSGGDAARPIRERQSSSLVTERPSTGLHRLSWHLLPLLRRLLPNAASDPRIFLLWAVTGAGKTEMMFPLLDAVLSAGGRAAVATPRRDVVLELAPRLAAAFPGARLAVLYGGSEDKFAFGDLTLATTHQLIRFQEAFDLVVIDEVDAFPYHNDEALHYAAAKAQARHGMTLLLSATPPPHMQRRARQGRLPHARVAVRYHRRPLPVPQRLAVPPLARWSAAASQGERRLPARLSQALRASVRRGAQLFLFVPYIRQVEPLVRLLRRHAPVFGIEQAAIDGTSSQDARRSEKVRQFRACTIRVLVTTTILERGVTIPRSDVFVLDADKPLFDAASLVQMAGRAGRSADDPHGRVYFAAAAWTQSQREACRQIREMNAFARRKGYLLGQAGATSGKPSAREVQR